MKNYPKISIVSPVLNHARFIEDTIRSVLDQHYPNLEYIIIDGGSTDGSVEIIKKYENHLAYWTSEKDRGLYYAIQKGFDKSSGEIMAWLNLDDVFLPKSLFLVAEIFRTFNHVKWIQGMPSCIDEEGKIVWVSDLRQWSKYRYYLYDFYTIQQESTFWRRSLWTEAGSTLDLSLKFAADFELWLRFFNHSELHSVRTALASARHRLHNQLSKDHHKEYIEEANNTLHNRIKNLSGSEKKRLRLLNLYRFLTKVPLIRGRFINKFMKLHDFPPVIEYNRNKNGFFPDR